MRHLNNSKILGSPLWHILAIIRNLVISLLKYQEIKTTNSKAKQTQRFTDLLIILSQTTIV